MFPGPAAAAAAFAAAGLAGSPGEQDVTYLEMAPLSKIGVTILSM
jgi:hypothetical protein